MHPINTDGNQKKDGGQTRDDITLAEIESELEMDTNTKCDYYDDVGDEYSRDDLKHILDIYDSTDRIYSDCDRNDYYDDEPRNSTSNNLNHFIFLLDKLSVEEIVFEDSYYGDNMTIFPDNAERELATIIPRISDGYKTHDVARSEFTGNYNNLNIVNKDALTFSNVYLNSGEYFASVPGAVLIVKGIARPNLVNTGLLIFRYASFGEEFALALAASLIMKDTNDSNTCLGYSTDKGTGSNADGSSASFGDCPFGDCSLDGIRSDDTNISHDGNADRCNVPGCDNGISGNSDVLNSNANGSNANGGNKSNNPCDGTNITEADDDPFVLRNGETHNCMDSSSRKP